MYMQKYIAVASGFASTCISLCLYTSRSTSIHVFHIYLLIAALQFISVSCRVFTSILHLATFNLQSVLSTSILLIFWDIIDVYIFLSLHTYSHRFASITYIFLNRIYLYHLFCQFTSICIYRNLAIVDVTFLGWSKRLSDLASNDRGSNAPIESLGIHMNITLYMFCGVHASNYICSHLSTSVSLHIIYIQVRWPETSWNHTICIVALAVALLLAEDLDCIYGCVRVLSAMRWPQKPKHTIRKTRTMYYVGLPVRTNFTKMLEIYRIIELHLHQ